MNIVFRSVPIIILSLANSNCAEVNLSAPSTAALMAAIFTKFERSIKIGSGQNSEELQQNIFQM